MKIELASIHYYLALENQLKHKIMAGRGSEREGEGEGEKERERGRGRGRKRESIIHITISHVSLYIQNIPDTIIKFMCTMRITINGSTHCTMCMTLMLTKLTLTTPPFPLWFRQKTE